MDEPTAFKTQLQEEGSHNPHKIFLEHLDQVIRKTEPLSPTGHLLDKTVVNKP